MLNVYVKCQSTFFRTFPFWIDMSRDPDDDNAILITNNKRSSTVALTSCYIRQSVRVSLFRFFVLTQTGTVFCFRSKEKLLTRRYLNVFSFEIKADSVQKYLHHRFFEFTRDILFVSNSIFQSSAKTSYLCNLMGDIHVLPKKMLTFRYDTLSDVVKIKVQSFRCLNQGFCEGNVEGLVVPSTFMDIHGACPIDKHHECLFSSADWSSSSAWKISCEASSVHFLHSSIKELLPPGRGPAVVAQQCPVRESLFLPPRRDSPSEWIFQAAWYLVRGLYTRGDGGVSSCKQMHWVASTSDELLNEKIVLEKYIKHLFLNIWPLFLFFLYFWEAFPTKHAFF